MQAQAVIGDEFIQCCVRSLKIPPPPTYTPDYDLNDIGSAFLNTNFMVESR